MTALVFKWDDHNRLIQHDQVVAYGDGDTGREEGQETVFEFRYRADTLAPWSEAEILRFTTPRECRYDPPGDGFVHVTCYTTRQGATSWQAHVGIIRVVGGVPAIPANRITTTGDRRVTTSGAARITTG